MIPPAEIEPRLAAVRGRIAAAARRAGRDPAAVTLIGVSKRVPAALAAAGVRAGLRDLGESYVQEARAKIPEVEKALAAEGVPAPRWHLVGRLQRNKAGEAARLFGCIHAVDGARLAEALDRRAGALGRTLEGLVQVNLSEEPQKAGVEPEALLELLEACAALPHLRVIGLMTLPALAGDPERTRPVFARLRELLEAARSRPGGGALRELSMGMTADFEVAIEEGATIVRVGTAIFGPRGERP